MGGDRAPLTRQRIVRAAITLADREGSSALGMRPLAGWLGVTPMALYNHVPGIAALRGEIADALAGDIALPARSLGWQARLRELFWAIRRVHLAHPGAAAILRSTGRVSEPVLRPVEEALAALADGGLEPTEAARAWAALIGLTTGHADYQLGGHLEDDDPGVRAAELSQAVPHVAHLLEAGAPIDWDTAFGRALDTLIDGLADRRR